MQIIKTIFPNKSYPLFLKRESNGNISCSIKIFNESTCIFLKELNYVYFPNWEAALEAAYNVVYKHIDVPKPEVKDLIPQIVKMNDKIFLERQNNNTYDISIANCFNEIFTKIANAKDLNSAIKKAEKIISLLDDTVEV